MMEKMESPEIAIARAYQGGRWLRGYIRGKLRTDPVFAAGAAAATHHSGPIIDLGCGLGLFGMYLRTHGIRLPYRGCDLSLWKIRAGNDASSRLGFSDFSLKEGDMTTFPLDGAACVCAFDVLHYLPLAEQTRFIDRLADAAHKGAVILLRTGSRGCGWRSAFTMLEEFWARGTGWISGGQINFPRVPELTDAFEKRGCEVEVRPLLGKTPFSSHWLQVAAKH